MDVTTWISTSTVASSNDPITILPGGASLAAGPLSSRDGSSPAGFGPISISSLQENLAFYGYLLLFLLGFFGHVNTILIFLRRTLRSVSTSCLFICVSVSDTIYLLVCIYDFLYTGLNLSYLSQASDPNVANILCRFRSFIQSVAMCSSAWLLLAIAIDRWVRIRFPFQVRRLCTRKRAFFGAVVVVVCAMVLNSHLLTSSMGNVTLNNVCGPVGTAQYEFFYRQVWGILFACLQIFLPTILLFIGSIDMFYRLRMQQKQRQRLNSNRRQTLVDTQMLIIMLTSIFLFFCTQIPLGLFNILIGPVLRFRFSLKTANEVTTVINFIASINFATTFYMHCLTSGLFRGEFLNTIRCSRRHRVGFVTQMAGTNTIQAQTGPQPAVF